MYDEEELVNTTLILKIDVGKFPKGMKPEDFEEYLAQSDHIIQECVIIDAVQEN